MGEVRTLCGHVRCTANAIWTPVSNRKITNQRSLTKMTRSSIMLAVIFLASGTIFSQSAAAQYTPQRSTVSPWMGLWQRNTGAMDNYHTFVQPQMELNKTLQVQGSALNRQETGLQDLNYEMMQPQGNRSTMTPTGQGATFMSYSHYYGGSRQLSRPVPSRPPTSRTAHNSPTSSGMSR